MQHSFDINIATQYGVNVAIFLNNIVFWIKKNEANKKHFHEGRYWTYNSSEALNILLPYWSTDQLDRLVKKCKELGLLLTNNFNHSSYDRTRWYGLTDKALKLFGFSIPQNSGIEENKPRFRSRETAEPIPDINTDIKTDIKDYRSTDVEHECSFELFWNEYPRKEKKVTAKKIWSKNKLYKKAELIIQAIKKRCETEWRDRDKQYIPLPDTYLRGERWNDETLETTTPKITQSNTLRSNYNQPEPRSAVNKSDFHVSDPEFRDRYEKSSPNVSELKKLIFGINEGDTHGRGDQRVDRPRGDTVRKIADFLPR